MVSFTFREIHTVSDALDISEDITGNHFKLSAGHWKRHGYDVKTLCSLKDDEISHSALAVLIKGIRRSNPFASKTSEKDFYFICLQDHLIKQALMRDERLSLLPLLVYVFTHELVHIVRFAHFLQRFDLPPAKRDEEESIVHSATHEILNDLSLPDLPYVLDVYQTHRRGHEAFGKVTYL